jgi:hypothetical protein
MDGEKKRGIGRRSRSQNGEVDLRPEKRGKVEAKDAFDGEENEEERAEVVC